MEDIFPSLWRVFGFADGKKVNATEQSSFKQCVCVLINIRRNKHLIDEYLDFRTNMPNPTNCMETTLSSTLLPSKQPPKLTYDTTVHLVIPRRSTSVPTEMVQIRVDSIQKVSLTTTQNGDFGTFEPHFSCWTLFQTARIAPNNGFCQPCRCFWKLTKKKIVSWNSTSTWALEFLLWKLYTFLWLMNWVVVDYSFKCIFKCQILATLHFEHHLQSW